MTRRQVWRAGRRVAIDTEAPPDRLRTRGPMTRFTHNLGSLPGFMMSSAQRRFVMNLRAFEAERASLIARYGDGFAVYVRGTFSHRVDEASAAARPWSDDDSAWFRIEHRFEQMARAALDPRPTDALLCEPFLDTDVPASLYEADMALAARGWRPARIAAARAALAPGLWWNALWWEWGQLDLRDALVGWALTLGAIALVSVASLRAVGAGLWWVAPTVALCVAALCLATARWLGARR